MLIPKNIQPIIDFVSKDEYRLAIQNVQLERLDAEKVRLSATNGHALATITYEDNQETNDQFPIGNDSKQLHATIKDGFKVSIDKGSLADTFKCIPKKTNMPIIENIAVDEKATNGHVTLTTYDLQALRTIEVKTPPNDKFPNIDAVIPKDEPKMVIGFGSELLGKALLSISKMQGQSKMVRMEFFDANSPVKITATGDNGEEILVVVMPMRLEGVMKS